MPIAVTGISDTPTEVLERILDFLHDDRMALCSASLVSRRWVHTPRHHLFNRTLLTEISGRGRLIKENARSFIALAQSEKCTILPAIRYIILVLDTPELIDDVVKVLARSKALSRMVYTHSTPSNSISWIARVLPNIHDFTFDFLGYTFGDDAWHLIRSFPNLSTLAVYTERYATITLPLDISSSPFQNLRTLHLRLNTSEELFDRLIHLDGTHFALETLDLRLFRSCHRSWGSVNKLNLFLAEISETLKHLSLGIDYLYADFDNDLLNKGSQINLSPLINLHSLFLRAHDLSAVCDSLQSLSSPSVLEELTVQATEWGPDLYVYRLIKYCDCALSNHLTRFSGILEGQQFISLKSLNLDVPGSLDLNDVAQLLMKWEKRGVLKLSYVSNEDNQVGTLDSIRPLIWPGKLKT